MNWSEMLVDPIKEMWSQFLTYVPNILGALIILIVGWIIARTIQTVVDKALRLPNINDDFRGAGPDLGAYEAGQAMPVYGPRPAE